MTLSKETPLTTNAPVTEPVTEPDWTPVHPLDTAEEDGGWLPTFDQIRMAVILQSDLAIGPDPAGVPFHRGLHSSMRQAFGLVGLVALIASLSSIAAAWFGWGTRVFSGPVAAVIQLLSGDWSLLAQLSLFGNDELTVDSVVGGAPWLWALGAWVSAPVRLWTIWLVGGLLVFAVARMIGARNTLPRIFAATGYAFLPLLLFLLLPIPWVGLVALIVASILFVLIYVQGVQIATQMEWGHVIIAVLLPLVLCIILVVLFPAVILFL